MVESGKGELKSALNVISDQVNKRLSQLDIGDASLVVGRIDQEELINQKCFILAV